MSSATTPSQGAQGSQRYDVLWHVRPDREGLTPDGVGTITYGAVQRVRPKLMTVSMITLGLVPALWAHGAGAEAIQRIAAPMIGGLLISFLVELVLYPVIYYLYRSMTERKRFNQEPLQ